jgi:hypothetical protein
MGPSRAATSKLVLVRSVVRSICQRVDSSRSLTARVRTPVATIWSQREACSGDAQRNPAAVDWNITIDAAAGAYTYFCFIHPAMRGTFRVVDRDDSTTTQSQIDDALLRQFNADRSAGLDAERDANVVRFSGGTPGTRTYDVSVGVSAADDHVRDR